MMKLPTDEEIIKELRRELKMRHSVYPGLVRRGKLSQAQADRQICLLQAAIERIQGDLPEQQNLF